MDGGADQYEYDDDYEQYPEALSKQLHEQLQLIKDSTQLLSPVHR